MYVLCVLCVVRLSCVLCLSPLCVWCASGVNMSMLFAVLLFRNKLAHMKC